MNSIISGESFQQLCDVYLGFEYKKNINPKLAHESHKHIDLFSLTAPWDNPKILFCYGDCLREFMKKLHLLRNPCILVSHNADTNITEEFLNILDNPRIVRWYAQNPCIKHRKLHLLPIGIANQMWSHGNLSIMNHVLHLESPKTDRTYFFFNVDTNRSEREHCKQIVSSLGLTWGVYKSYGEYLEYLSKCKFAICPPGNGVDSHRIWECFYLRVIPVVLRSVFTEQLSKIMPCIVLSSWCDFDESAIIPQYEALISKLGSKYLDLNYYKAVFQTIGKCIPRVSELTPCTGRSYAHVDNTRIQLDYKLDYLIGKTNGFFIELGANDGLTQSNTAYFEFSRDWRGVLVEPSKNVYEQCVSNRPKSVCFNCACVSDTYTESEILGDFSGSLMSSVDGSRLHSNELIRVQSATLESLLDKAIPAQTHQTIDFMSLDVEGYELPILKGLNLKKYSPVYLLIEVYDKDYDTILDFMHEHGYTMLVNFSNYNRHDNPYWSGEHNDYLFVLDSQLHP